LASAVSIVVIPAIVIAAVAATSPTGHFYFAGDRPLLLGVDIGLELNRQAYERLRAENRFEVIPGATHLFEEPGAFEAVARLATAGFRHHLIVIELQQTASETSRGI